MAQSEKLPLARAPPRSENRRSCLRKAGNWALLTLVIVLGLFTRFSLYGRIIATDDGSSTAAQCPQVEPLVPSQSSPALAQMEDFLASDKFRNQTIARMAGAIQIPTQSYDDMGDADEDERWEIFHELHAYLEKTFPLVHKTLKLEKVNTYGLLFTWQGDKDLKPTVLMAHQDVVPVAVPTWDQWTHPPFSGHYDGKYVWGRGASDCKNTLIGILEAVELLIDAGFTPKRTLVLSFGFDEEISGRRGAGHLASVLIDRYGKDGAAIIIDEGSGVTSSWGSTFALPGVGEKGYMDVEIIVRMPGGHSSIPPAHNGIGVMSELITLIEANPYEPQLYSDNPFLGLLHCGASHSPEFPHKIKKLLPSHKGHVCGKKDKLAQEAAKLGDEIKYLFTTSVAPDIIDGGVKVNALPERTRLVVNHRINVGTKSTVVKEKLTKLAGIVGKKYNLTVNAFSNETETPRSITLSTGPVLEPAPVSPTLVGKTPYSILSGTTRAMYGEKLIMAPGIMTGNTDTRYYWDLTKHIFRYIPGWDPEWDFMEGIHTVDEKVGVLGHIRNVQYFSLFIRNMDEADLE